MIRWTKYAMTRPDGAVYEGEAFTTNLNNITFFDSKREAETALKLLSPELKKRCFIGEWNSELFDR